MPSRAASLAAILTAILAASSPGDTQAQPDKSKAPAKADRPLTQEEKDRAADAAKAAGAAGAGFLGMGLLCTIFAVVASLLFYMLPTFVGVVRKHPNLMPIFIVNFFLGWLLVGWVVALAWAFSAQESGGGRGDYRRRSARASSDDDDNPFS